MKRFLASICALALCAGAVGAGSDGPPPFDASQFEPVTFKGFQRHQAPPSKGREWILNAAMPGLAVVAAYAGKARRIDGARSEFLRQVGVALKNPSISTLYRREIEVVDQGRPYWIPVQEEVFPHLARELKPGQEVTLFVRHLGGSVATRDLLYLLIEFDARPPRRVPRSRCFTRELFGIALGQPIAPVLRDLEARYGPPRALSQGQQSLRLFIVDRQAETYIIVGDAGSGYRDRVFSLQYTGRPSSRPAIHESLRLGSTPAEVENVLGRAASRAESGEGYTKLTFAGSTCSVELRDGALASVLITDDPNYFAE